MSNTDPAQKQQEYKGLKRLRNNPKAELVQCSNCGHKRYGDCSCKKKG